MKIMRCVLAIAMLCGLATMAKADPVDFQMVVIDPPPSYSVNIITNDSFTFSFAPCVSPGQVPSGTSFVGCFTGQNETGADLTSLLLQIPLIQGQTAGCSMSGTGLDIFSSATCTDTANGYVLSFTGGDISPNELFTIAEAGVDPGSFPTVSAQFNAATPEPGSLLLLSTGILVGGLFLVRNRPTFVNDSTC